MVGGNREVLPRDIYFTKSPPPPLGLRHGGEKQRSCRTSFTSSSYWPHVSTEAMNMGLFTAAEGEKWTPMGKGGNK